MRSLNLDQLRTLVFAADLGTFSAAATALHLSQPTVSLHIAELEERLGVRLLLRGSGGVVICRKFSKKVSTPKLVNADPKNTGLNLPWRTFSISNS